MDRRGLFNIEATFKGPPVFEAPRRGNQKIERLTKTHSCEAF